jgi:hypothetical protein
LQVVRICRLGAWICSAITGHEWCFRSAD